MFESADPYKLPPRSLAASIGLHSAAVVMLCVVGFPSLPLHPRKLRAILLAPPLERPILRAQKIPVPPPRIVAPAFHAPQTPKLVAPVPDPPPAPPAEANLEPPALPVHLPEQAPSLPSTPPVKLGSFENAKLTTLAPIPPARLESAGFDAAASVSTTRHAVPSQSAGFDAAAVANSAHRASSTRPSGFGDVKPGASAGPGRPTVLSASFGDTAVTAPERHASNIAASTTIPVEILDKPKPAYTDEARRLNIQGEVLVDVAFDATGEARVLRVIRGLGHGLDETASAAARQIHFRPARREGTPVDSSAVVHIVFQLAN